LLTLGRILSQWRLQSGFLQGDFFNSANIDPAIPKRFARLQTMPLLKLDLDQLPLVLIRPNKQNQTKQST
jgi:hypothetical protein